MKNTSPGIRDYDRIQDVYLAIYLLAMSTTLVNPIVYYTINSKFRQYFHRYAFRYLLSLSYLQVILLYYKKLNQLKVGVLCKILTKK